VRVKGENSSVRWRRPHLRTPGYIFGLIGRIERPCVGLFGDPELKVCKGGVGGASCVALHCVGLSADISCMLILTAKWVPPWSGCHQWSGFAFVAAHAAGGCATRDCCGIASVALLPSALIHRREELGALYRCCWCCCRRSGRRAQSSPSTGCALHRQTCGSCTKVGWAPVHPPSNFLLLCLSLIHQGHLLGSGNPTGSQQGICVMQHSENAVFTVLVLYGAV
jgi:hypothetical protein